MIEPFKIILLGLLLVTSSGAAAPGKKSTFFNAEASLVEIEVTRKAYNYSIPWRISNQQIRKNGIVISQNRILTTADGLSDQYLCRIRKGGQSIDYRANILWVDYHTNIALLDVADAAFWKAMRPVKLAEKIPMNGDLKVYRWSSGRIESRAAEISRLFIDQSKTSYVSHFTLAASTEMNAAGWAEVVIHRNGLVGLTSSASEGGQLKILPAPFIKRILRSLENGDRPVAAFFDFKWMRGKNPALMRYKGFDREGTGIIITEIGQQGLSDNTLKVGDILFEVDGFPVDNDGKYIDPDYGRLSISGLATRSHFAGESIRMKVWRERAELDLNYLLPAADFRKSVIPERCYDQPPEYYLAGGLVFQPVSGPLIRALGQSTTLLLDHYYERPPIQEKEGLVLLSMVLPDTYNQGYEYLRLHLIDQINGLPINNLEEVGKALDQPLDGYHRIRFMSDESMLHIVLDAEELPAATERILQRYRIPQQSYIKSSKEFSE